MKDHSGFDCIIVGQGLAGTCLAFTLEKYYSKKVFVIDRDAGECCSAIAAGTFNPIVFKTLSPAWKSDVIIPFMLNFYRELSDKLGTELVEERPVFKMLKGHEQKKLWLIKSAEFPSSKYMEKEIQQTIEGVNGPDGFGVVGSSGNLKIKELIDKYRNYLKEKKNILEEELKYEKLKITDGGVQYGNIFAPVLVFCQGHESRNNPFFGNIPFKEAKGEVLIIKVRDWNPPGIISNNINIVPMGRDLFWVGSTFDWDDLTTNRTTFAKDRLLDQLKETLQVDFEVIDQLAGVRPTVKDRRPVLGRHAEYRNIMIFNGMGTRGVMLAPYFSDLMARYMEGFQEIEREVNYNRFSV